MAATPSGNTLPLHPVPAESSSSWEVGTASAPARQSMEPDNSSAYSSGLSPIPLQNNVSCSTLCCPSKLSCCLACFLPCCLACHQVDVRNESVILNYGRYVGTLREPGCYCINNCGTVTRSVNTAINSMDLPQLKVLDSRGNPLRVSGVVTWVVVDSRKALLDVQQYSSFLRNQSEVVMKQICSMHPYEARPGSNEESLKTESGKISADVIELLQKKVSQAGLRVIEYQFNEISYAPEIASQMLVRQQAEAMLDARKVVVEGAVQIAHDAIIRMREHGMTMQPAEINRLASNIIITICSESRVTPTLNLSGSE